VLVLRLAAQGSIEEHILRVAEEKRKFADSSITGVWLLPFSALPCVFWDCPASSQLL
jgi:hypothetical protein